MDIEKEILGKLSGEYKQGMLELVSNNNLIILRDVIEADIGDFVRWNTTEIEWMNWDAPWEKEDEEFEPIKERARWTKYFENSKLKPIDRIRTRLEICINNKEKTHKGWVSYYDIDQFFKYTKDFGNCTIGIGILNKSIEGMVMALLR